MSNILGKRKRQVRRAQISEPEEPQDHSDREALQAALARAFEARFKPLEVTAKNVVEETSSYESGEDDSEDGVEEVADDFEGFSSEDEDGKGIAKVEVVDYASSQQPDFMSPSDAKAFMSSKPPTIGIDSTMQKKSTKNGTQGEEEDKNDKLNLKNDLALQRLINESHLLEKTKSGSPSGHRQRITEMRLQSLGSKGSILAQEKMPMSHRRGIIAKSHERESRRRTEAKENGIILEKATKVKQAQEKRTRGVGGPSVGSFKGGTLTLSKGDISNIKSTKVTREGRRRR